MITYNHNGIKFVRITTPLTEDDINDYMKEIPIRNWGAYEVSEDGVGINGMFFNYLKERNYLSYEKLAAMYVEAMIIEVGIEIDTILATFDRRFHNTKRASSKD